MSASTHTHLFWITSRAAGTTAIVLASLTVAFGLLMSGRMLRRLLPERRAIHEVLSLSVIVAIAVHGLALLGDSYLRPSLLDIAVPFASSYRLIWTSLGIAAGWALAALGLSYYLRRWIGPSRWRSIHRFTLLAWAAALLHTFAEGSDAGSGWFVALILITSAPAILALLGKFGPSLMRLSNGSYRPLTDAGDARS